MQESDAKTIIISTSQNQSQKQPSQPQNPLQKRLLKKRANRVRAINEAEEIMYEIKEELKRQEYEDYLELKSKQNSIM